MKTIRDTTINQTLERVGHCLYRSVKSKIHYAILKRAGKQIKRSLKTTDRILAKRRLLEFQDKAAENPAVPDPQFALRLESLALKSMSVDNSTYPTYPTNQYRFPKPSCRHFQYRAVLTQKLIVPRHLTFLVFLRRSPRLRRYRNADWKFRPVQ